MDMTMYEDGSYNAYSRENVAQMKRKLNLDLSGGRMPKKVRVNTPNFNALLTSPDLHMLKLASPELEELVLQQGGLMPPTSCGFLFPSPHYITKIPTTTVQTVASEEFIKGFEDTLDQLHKKDSIIVSSAPSLSNQLQYTQLEVAHQQVPVTSCNDDMFTYSKVKEEPQTVPSVCGSPPMSPIDMEDQERIKLERKRLRNRIAASKCRKRKLERISKLEGKVNLLKNENTDLQTIVNRLRDQVCHLKTEVMEHVNVGCQIPFVNAQ